MYAEYAESEDQLPAQVDDCVAIGSFTPDEIGTIFHSSILAANE